MQQVAGPVAASSWLLALLAVMFTYSGWNAASYMAEEIRDPGRNVPRALALGTGAVIVVYLLLNALYLYVMPVGELAKVQGSVLDVVADKVLGSAAGNIMGAVSIVSLLASVSANIFAGPRVYYAMARDGVFLPAAARIHPAYRTPSVAIIAQAVWASILIMSGSADALTTYTGFAVTLFATVAVAAVFVLRSREPNAERPFKALGYPYTPALFVIVGTATVINGVYSAPYTTLAGLAVMAAGIPLYLYFGRKS
jgi:APA family basic amino acid/polyamine antiporter